MLSAGVCVYYLSLVYFAWSEEKILRYQRVLIIFPIIWGLMTAILTLSRGMINPNPVTGECWLYSSPMGCTGSKCTPDEYYSHLYRFVFLHIPRWISFGVGAISMCCVYYKVSKEEQEHGGEAPAGWLWFVQHEEGQDTSRTIRSRRMARQAFWYLLNFFLTYVGSTVWSIVVASGGTPSFGLMCYTFIFQPWQGFWNAIIYVRPRYMRNREKNPNMSTRGAIVTEDEYDHRLGARAMRSTVVPSAKRSFLGSLFRKSGQGEGTEAEAELAQVPEEGSELA
jgi:hypothetical protein